jgi:hypothetical protein
MTDPRPDAQTQKVLFPTRLQRVPAGRETAEHRVVQLKRQRSEQKRKKKVNSPVPDIL